MSSIALLCVVRNEQPFLAEWLHHHFAIGVDRIYVVSTDDELQPMRSWGMELGYGDRVRWFHYRNVDRGWQAACYNHHLLHISEDWIVVLDADEFLSMSRSLDLSSFLDGLPTDVGQVQFPWINAIAEQPYVERVGDLFRSGRGHASDHVKSAVRRSALHSFRVHAHDVGGTATWLSSGREVPPQPIHDALLDEHRYALHHPVVLHAPSRGYLDVISKVLDQRFHSPKCGEGEQRRVVDFLTGDAEADVLEAPTRFVWLDVLAALPPVEFEASLATDGPGVDVGALEDRTRALLARNGVVVDRDATVADALVSTHRLPSKLGRVRSMLRPEVDPYRDSETPMTYVAQLRADARDIEPERVQPVFIHINKTAGSSIRASASDSIRDAGHQMASAWVAANGQEAPLFTVVRNPFDRMVSEYAYRRRRLDEGDANEHLSNLHKDFPEWVIATLRDGEMRTRAFFEHTGIGFNEHNMVDDALIWFHPQARWVRAADGECLVEHVLRFERLDDDWASFADRFDLPAPLQHVNASPRSTSYRDQYTEESRLVVAEFFAEDLEMFGYEF